MGVRSQGVKMRQGYTSYTVSLVWVQDILYPCCRVNYLSELRMISVQTTFFWNTWVSACFLSPYAFVFPVGTLRLFPLYQ